MGARKKHAPCRETINVRCLRLLVAPEAADPLVGITYRDEEHVGLRCLGMSFPGEEKRKDGNCDCLNTSDSSSAIHTYFRGSGTKGMAVLLIPDSH